MKKLFSFITTSLLLSLSFAVSADSLDDFYTKAKNSETVTLSVVKESVANMVATVEQVTHSSNFTEVYDDTSLLGFGGTTYLSTDGNKLYVVRKKDELGYPHYVYLEYNNNGVENVKTVLYTSLSEEALNFKGSNDTNLNLNVSLNGLFAELPGQTLFADLEKVTKFFQK